MLTALLALIRQLLLLLVRVLRVLCPTFSPPIVAVVVEVEELAEAVLGVLPEELVLTPTSS